MKTMQVSKKLRLKILTAIVAAPFLLASAFFANLYFSQEDLIFPGTKLSRQHQFAFDVPFSEVTVPVDGAEISGLHFQQPSPRGLIFFLHGNGGNLESWTTNVGYYQRVNYDLFIFDYRGYGKSTGSIESEQQLHDDVRAAWDQVVPQYADKPVVIYGRSLGAALAAKLATDVKTDLLILVSPFTSMVAMARQQYPFLPEWFVRYPLRTEAIISRITAPTVFVHGDDDRFIPPSHSNRLRSLATSTKNFLLIKGAGHGDIHTFQSYLDGLTNALPD